MKNLFGQLDRKLLFLGTVGVGVGVGWVRREQVACRRRNCSAWWKWIPYLLGVLFQVSRIHSMFVCLLLVQRGDKVSD
jgi:cytochrome c oxidase assembly factor CtaG|tara:strand:- start:123 stop:356 length:234 start_codon:yes stop_codon:yes gene_type:complete